MSRAHDEPTRRIRPPGPDQKVTLKHYVQYGLVRLFNGLAKLLPLAVLRAFGAMLGNLFHMIDKRHRVIALINVDLVFGTRMNDAEKRAMVKRTFRHFGIAMMETLAAQRINKHNLRDHATWTNLEEFHTGLAAGKGVILCSAHYGNWEIMNLALGFQDLPLSAMARPIDNPLVDRFVEKVRTRSGNRVIFKHKGLKPIISNLKANRIVGIVNDQDIHGPSRIMLPFFGHQAATTPMPATLSYRTGAPIITGYAVPLGKGRYHLKYGKLIWPDQTADKASEIERISRLLNQRLEAQIEAEPYPWLWMHKRYKTGPNGKQRPIYKQRGTTTIEDSE